MLATTNKGIEIRPTGACLGADVVGADLRSDADFAVIRQAWLSHLVLRFRGAFLTDGEHVALARRFGELDFNPGTRLTGKIYVEGFPEIVRISNIVENGKPIGELGAGEAAWHTDMCFIDEPPSASLLRAIELPPAGGETSFMNMYRAYETLPAELRKAVDGRQLKHDGVYATAGKQRPGTVAPASDDIRDIAGAVHPLVRTHPDTRRRCLYVGKRLNAYIIGLPVDESEAILDSIWAHLLDPGLIWTQVWEPGDLVIWDNRCVMHQRSPFDDKSRRLLHRTVVKGSRPF